MPHRIAPLAIAACTATSAAGRGREQLAQALAARTSGLTRNDFSSVPLACWIGRVAGLEDAPLPADWARFDARNQRLAWLGLQQDDFLARARAARARYGADRVALVLGTSTSSIGETESAYRTLDADGRFNAAQRARRVHEPHSLAAFVQTVLELHGPCLTIATACSSSAKVFASAERLIRAGCADAAIVGGVDTLCDSVLFGFNSLGLVSTEPCRPFDKDRSGLSLGEAAGFALLERMPQSGEVDFERATHGSPVESGNSPPDSGGSESGRVPDSRRSADPGKGSCGPRLMLLGYGESSDAHHMSAPHPQGLGAEHALDDALARAGIETGQVDYINLHGTASRANDEVEAALIARRFPATTRASSTKGWTGHTLGAAGILEAVITLLALERGFVPGTLNTRELDPVCGPQLALANAPAPLRIALSNSFGFGGNNCCLAFARGAGA